MSVNIPTKATVRGIINDLIELADQEKRPAIQEIKDIKELETLFTYLKQNYSPREYWLSGASDRVKTSKRADTWSSLWGILIQDWNKKNGVLPIIASLAMYMNSGDPFCRD
ncbi:MAG: hypothetical protein WAO91_01685 [Candidatus Nitrosotenuis sp.]